jgi:hypothetical protein
MEFTREYESWKIAAVDSIVSPLEKDATAKVCIYIYNIYIYNIYINVLNVNTLCTKYIYIYIYMYMSDGKLQL